MSDNPMNANAMIETPLMRGLERVLDQSTLRHQILSTNIANVDTPRYRTRDLPTFAGQIEQAMAESGDEASPGTALLTPVAREVRGLIERPDGNNVSVERESLLLAQNQLRFEVAVAFLKSEFHNLSMAINGGMSTS
ncbi:MAG: flagellar basal body rod protein FlgB [Terriglobales bacterium]|jgi:flagellar basal-body rod protein FlgB